MTIRIEDDLMTHEVDGAVVATARFSQHAAADGNGAWIVSNQPTALHGRRLDLGRVDGGTRRQSPEQSRTTPSRVEPSRRHRGYDRCQPSSRSEPWPHRCPGERMARPGPSRFVRTAHAAHQRPNTVASADATPDSSAPPTDFTEPPVVPPVSSVEQTVRTRHAEGRSQRAIARDLNIDRRKVKQIIDHAV